MSTYVPSLNLLFIHSPYTASRAVSEYLQEQHQGRRVSTKMHMGVKETLETLGGTSKPPQVEAEPAVEVIKGGVTLYRYDLGETPLTVTTVRHPYDIMVTMYLKRCPGKDFKYFLHEIYPLQDPTTPDFRMHLELLQGIDRILHYEVLQEDVATLMKSLGVRSRVELPLIGKTPEKKNYLSYYNEITAQLTFEYAREYFEVTGYSPTREMFHTPVCKTGAI